MLGGGGAVTNNLACKVRFVHLGFGTKQYVGLYWSASESLYSRLLKQNQGTGSIARMPCMQEVLGSIPSTGDKIVLKQKQSLAPGRDFQQGKAS